MDTKLGKFTMTIIMILALASIISQTIYKVELTRAASRRGVAEATEPVTIVINLNSYEKENDDIAESVYEPPIPSSTELEELSVKPLEGKDLYFYYIEDICLQYPNVDPNIIKSIMYHESSYRPDVYVGDCVGLMQVSTYWHKDRAKKLGINDFFDPYANIHLAVDYISELSNEQEDIRLVLMLYNMKRSTAFNLYNKGTISEYAKSVIAMSEEFRNE